MDEGTREGVGMRQRLVAILAGDAVGYSRLMALDDAGTLAALDGARATFREQAAAHGGRVVDTAGDSVLAVFETAIGAMRAALEAQRAIDALAAAQPSERALRFRVGLHLGDVIEKADGSVYGDGVNVAARLQALASAGGVCVSDTVRAAVGQRLGVAYDDAGLQSIKNIAEAVRVFQVHPANGSAPGSSASRRAGLIGRLTPLRAPWFVSAFVMVCIAAAWWWYRSDAREPRAITMSVALGPISGSGDTVAEGERLSRALATGISAYAGHVRVIAPPVNAVDLVAFRDAARNAGARYVVEGDLQTTAPQRQLSLRLIDIVPGRQVWSGSFDWPDAAGTDRTQLALRSAVGVLAFAVGDAEVKRVLPKPVAQLDAMERVVRSYGVLHEGPPTLAGAREAIELLEEARKLDPTLVPALLMMGDALEMLRDMDPQLDPARYTREVDEVSLRATRLEPDSPIAWHARSTALMRLRRWDAASEASARFVRLDPYNPLAILQRADLLVALGRPFDALPLIEKAMSMSTGGRSGAALITACHAHLLTGASEKAVAACEKANLYDDVFIQTLLTAAYANSGNESQSRAALSALLKLVPMNSVGMARVKGASDHPDYLKLAEPTLYQGLRKAGLRE